MQLVGVGGGGEGDELPDGNNLDHRETEVPGNRRQLGRKASHFSLL